MINNVCRFLLNLERRTTAMGLIVGLMTTLVHGPVDALTESFTLPGATTWTVPFAVTSLAVVATGGAGGAGGCCTIKGGNGGLVTVTLPVTPGQVLNLFIGGGGGRKAAYVSGGGGGGSTTIDPGTANQIIVGGGGGGGGGGGSGGNGGNGNGANGTGLYPGVGGSAGVGGAGGNVGSAFGGGAGGSGNGGPGGSADGAAGAGVAQAGSGGAGSGYSSGGGGGGYGGGGGGGNYNQYYAASVSGGGGGGSVGPAGATISFANNAVVDGAGGAGSIVFTYVANNVITFPTPANTALTSGPVALSATASTGLQVSYTSNTPAVCTVVGSNVTLQTAAVCSLTATQGGSANFGFAAATAVTKTFTVLKGAQTITFPAQVPSSSSFVAGGTFAINPLAASTSGLSPVYSSISSGVCTVSANTVTMVSAGNCVLAANQTGDTNFSAATQATLGVAITAACSLDVDGDGVISPYADGMLLIRMMLGFTGNALTAGVIPARATRTTAAAIVGFVNANCGTAYVP